MNWFEALLLGILQGLTEFLPISSSGHLELGSYFLKIDNTDNLLFTIIVHFATAISILYVFRNDIKKLIHSMLKLEKNSETIFISKILISAIPFGIVGIFFEEKVESLFNGDIILVGSMLLITALLLTFTYFQKNNSKNEISYYDALIIGIAQAFAIIPGISRSGATISTALFLKINKKEATRFSFLMVLIPIFGIAFLKIYKGAMNLQKLKLEFNL